MSIVLTACQCRAFQSAEARCTSPATQEDLLCDSCRTGGGYCAAVGIDTAHAVHVRVTGFEISFR